MGPAVMQINPLIGKAIFAVMRTTTDLNNLRLVAEIAQSGTLAGAARRLGINHATAFRRLEKLERGLGVRLFERSGGRYVATEAGEVIARTGAVIEHEASEALRRVAGRDLRPSGLVRFTTTEGLAEHFAWPIACACRRRHPEIELQVITAGAIHNLSKRDADIALRTALAPPGDLIGKRIAAVAHAVYGAKRYLRGARKLQHLSDHDWIALDDSMSHHIALKWLAKIIPPERAKLRTNTYSGVLHACISGLGLAVLPCFLGDGAGALERVTEPLDDCRNELWLLMHRDMRNTARVKAVYQLMIEELDKSARAIAGSVG